MPPYRRTTSPLKIGKLFPIRKFIFVQATCRIVRTRQVLLAILVGASAAYAGFSLGWPLLAALTLFPVGFVALQTSLATIGRTRYWYRRGTRGRYSRSCPGCGQYIYRVGGDWILTCHRCGWRAGWPVIRWVTQSVPSRQLRRSASSGRLIIGFVGIIVITTNLAGLVSVSGLVLLLDSNSVVASDSTETTTPDPTIQHGYSREEVEDEFLQLLNAERRSRGKQSLSERDVLTEMGEAHSRNMAEYDYLGHVEPDGDTIEDRYRRRGLLPECRLPLDGSARYYEGAENAAYFWVNKRVQLTDEETFYVANETDLARGLFITWMNSPPHRKAMLVASADEAGLGLYIDERGKVYASLELC